MYQAIRYKFNFYPHLKELLLKTGNLQIIEHFEEDKYWSDGGDGSGKNRMGELLMRLRNDFKEQMKPKDGKSSQNEKDCIMYCMPEDPYGWMSNFYPAPFFVG